MVNISQRPDEALDRLTPGHWEGDLIVGKNVSSAISTVVERHSNYLVLIWIDPTKRGSKHSLTGLSRNSTICLRS